MKGLVLGAFTDDESGFKLTPVAGEFDRSVSGNITENLKVCGVKAGKARVFYRLSPEFGAVAVVGIGKESAGFNHDEDYDESKENIRAAVASGCKALQDLEVSEVSVDAMGDPEAAAEGAVLSTWLFQEFKEVSKRKIVPSIKMYSAGGDSSAFWDRGVIKADAQNLARRLADTPANRMTPTIFCQIAEQELSAVGVKVQVQDEKWAQDMKMGSFLSVAQGSAQPPRFLIAQYKGSTPDKQPIVLVGKGVTFDSGGISLKPSAKMDTMRADMEGAAIVVATMKAAAQLKLPLNIVGLTPLTENMPGGRATKPGDVVTAMNGKNIIVDNTDAEGRLILADALCYAASFSPILTIDIATLTGAMGIALGGAASGVFSTSTDRFTEMQHAGSVTGDRVWRFPLYKEYSKKMTDFASVDINNMGKVGGGGACKAAAFLKEFAPSGVEWMHLDIAGTFGPENDQPYLTNGISGRPTRTLIQFLMQKSLAC